MRLNSAAGRNFSLIELLIVVAVLAILASLLMPSLRKSMESAMNVLCKDKLKNIGVAYSNATGDRDEAFYLVPGAEKIF